MNNNTIFQVALESAHANHRTIRKGDIGESSFKEWQTICNAILANAYDVWADNHDQSGKPMQVVDPETAQAHKNALFGTLNAMVKFVGEVNFSDECSALLEVNQAMADTICGLAKKKGWVFSAEVEDLNRQIEDATYAKKMAEEDYARYNFNGVNEDAKTAKAQALALAMAELEALKTARKELIATPYAKVAEFMPNDEGKFRAELETAIYGMVMGQNAISYEAYKARREELRKARNERAKARKQAKKQAEANA